MASEQEKVFAGMLTKLGMSREDSIISKSMEILDLMNIKAPNLTRTLNDSAKVIFCIDISCELLKIQFDEATAIRQASLKSKSAYSKNRSLFKKLLDLNQKWSISSVILQLGISNPQVEKKSQKIFDAYKEQNPHVDMSNPQFFAMSVNQACKLEKVKAPKKILLKISNLSASQWQTFEKSWDQWVGDVVKVDKENRQQVVVGLDNENQSKTHEKRQKRKLDEEKEEDYDAWAKRILDQAYAELDRK